jgi:glycosyltransferase involved in cell wall biosynthesis
MRIIFLHKDNQIHIERFALAFRENKHDVDLLDVNELGYSFKKYADLKSYDVCIICPIVLLPENIEKHLPKNRIYISMAYDILLNFKVMEENQKKRLMKQIRKSTAFVCDSEFVKKELSLLIHGPEVIFNIPYGIDIDTLQKLSREAKPSNKIIEIAALRNWNLVHNQPGILDVFERLVENHTNLRLHIAGQGPEKVKEARRIKRLADSSVLIDHGAITNLEISKILESSHIYISNANVDGTSVTLLEAMYLKCLCLVPDIPSNREWIKNDENGFTFESLDETLEKSIKLFSESAYVSRITQNAHETVVERANWKQNSRDLVSFISDQCHA